MDLISNCIIVFILFMMYQYWNSHQMNIKSSLNHTLNTSFQIDIPPSPTNDTESNRLLVPLHNYKEYNPITYQNGMKHYRLYLRYSKKDPSSELYNHYIDKAYLHLKESVNQFQMMTIPTNETTKIQFLEDKSNSIRDNKHISKLIKDIYKQGIQTINEMIKQNKMKPVTNYSGFSEITFPEPYNGESLHLYY